MTFPNDERTETAPSGRRRRPRAEWTLMLAMDCQSLSEPPEVIALSGVEEVVVERGLERGVVSEGPRLRLACPDRWMSRDHARLVRGADGSFALEDGRSRNGTRLNGVPTTRKQLEDGDTIECGGTFLVMRQALPAANVEPLASRPEALRTIYPALDQELRLLRKVAESPIPVLILGESGTGKEGIAAAIHDLSGRKGPFVALNCGGVPATLIESELFGTRRGAFSGAEDRAGLFRTANHGTLLLDEIGELPASSQASFLRALQQREIVPLGASKPVAVDVRVIAATNQQLHVLMEDGRFRRDLYGRLNGYELTLPLLRQRREDLGLLVATLIERHDRTRVQRTLSREAARALFGYDWPLNIRELEQTISAALAIADREIGIDHLKGRVRAGGEAPPVVGALDRDTIMAAIRMHRGNMSAVARALSTSRSHLYRLLNRQSIRPREAAPKE